MHSYAEHKLARAWQYDDFGVVGFWPLPAAKTLMRIPLFVYFSQHHFLGSRHLNPIFSVLTFEDLTCSLSSFNAIQNIHNCLLSSSTLIEMAPTRQQTRRSTRDSTSCSPSPSRQIPIKSGITPHRSPIRRSPVKELKMQGLTIAQKQAIMDNIQLEGVSQKQDRLY